MREVRATSACTATRQTLTDTFMRARLPLSRTSSTWCSDVQQHLRPRGSGSSSSIACRQLSTTRSCSGPKWSSWLVKTRDGHLVYGRVLVEPADLLQAVALLLNFAGKLVPLALHLLAPSKDWRQLDRSQYIRLYVGGIVALLDEAWLLLCAVLQGTTTRSTTSRKFLTRLCSVFLNFACLDSSVIVSYSLWRTSPLPLQTLMI